MTEVSYSSVLSIWCSVLVPYQDYSSDILGRTVLVFAQQRTRQSLARSVNSPVCHFLWASRTNSWRSAIRMRLDKTAVYCVTEHVFRRTSECARQNSRRMYCTLMVVGFEPQGLSSVLQDRTVSSSSQKCLHFAANFKFHQTKGEAGNISSCSGN